MAPVGQLRLNRRMATTLGLLVSVALVTLIYYVLSPPPPDAGAGRGGPVAAGGNLNVADFARWLTPRPVVARGGGGAEPAGGRADELDAKVRELTAEKEQLAAELRALQAKAAVLERAAMDSGDEAAMARAQAAAAAEASARAARSVGGARGGAGASAALAATVPRLHRIHRALQHHHEGVRWMRERLAANRIDDAREALDTVLRLAADDILAREVRSRARC